MKHVMLVIVAVVASWATPGIADVVGSSDRAVRRVAHPILSNIIAAMDKQDYELASKDFSPQLKESLSASKFADAIVSIQQKHGKYRSRKYLSSLLISGGTKNLVLWKAKYDRDEVLIKLILNKHDDTIHVTGLWFE